MLRERERILAQILIDAGMYGDEPVSIRRLDYVTTSGSLHRHWGIWGGVEITAKAEAERVSEGKQGLRCNRRWMREKEGTREWCM